MSDNLSMKTPSWLSPLEMHIFNALLDIFSFSISHFLNILNFLIFSFLIGKIKKKNWFSAPLKPWLRSAACTCQRLEGLMSRDISGCLYV